MRCHHSTPAVPPEFLKELHGMTRLIDVEEAPAHPSCYVSAHATQSDDDTIGHVPQATKPEEPTRPTAKGSVDIAGQDF